VASQKQGATALVRLDLTAWKEVARVPVDKTPRGLELSPDGRRVFFTLAGVNAIQVLDIASNQIVAQIPHPEARDDAHAKVNRWRLQQTIPGPRRT
jgi:hypothetical protein